jgi:predicted phosphodiesterase
MRILIISDLHANLPATEAVLRHAAGQGWDAALVLGDLVGYGADPGPVIDLVRALPNAAVIRGNHDKVAAGIEDPSDFNAVARAAALWTAEQLDQERAGYLRTLPQGPLAADALLPGLVICHGAPFDEDYYVFDDDDAAAALEASAGSLVLCGHTHVQVAWRQRMSAGGRVLTRIDDWEMAVTADARMLVNPGSVGQPRDGDWRAAYATLDTGAGALTLHRVEYDVAEAQRRIRAAGLHPNLAERLSAGR